MKGACPSESGPGKPGTVGALRAWAARCYARCAIFKMSLEKAWASSISSLLGCPFAVAASIAHALCSGLFVSASMIIDSTCPLQVNAPRTLAFFAIPMAFSMASLGHLAFFERPMGREESQLLAFLQALYEILGWQRDTVGLDRKAAEDQGIPICFLDLIDGRKGHANPVKGIPDGFCDFSCVSGFGTVRYKYFHMIVLTFYECGFL